MLFGGASVLLSCVEDLVRGTTPGPFPASTNLQTRAAVLQALQTASAGPPYRFGRVASDVRLVLLGHLPVAELQRRRRPGAGGFQAPRRRAEDATVTVV